jgi:microcystin-dependent protein
MAYTIYEKRYNHENEINANNELTMSCKIIAGNKICNWSALGTYTVVEVLSDATLKRLDAKGRYCGVYESIEAYEAEDSIKINCYIIVDNIVYVIDVKDQIAIKISACNILNEGDSINAGIELAKQEGGLPFFLLDNVLYKYNTLTSELIEHKLFEEQKPYSNQKRYVLDNKTWNYIVHYLTRYSEDINDLKNYRDESTLIDDSSISSDKSYDSSFVASFLQGLPEEDTVIHNLQEVQRLLHIRAEKGPITAKNGGLVTNDYYVNDDPEGKAFSSQILNQKFKNTVLLENDLWLEHCSTNQFLDVLQSIDTRTGKYEDLRVANKDVSTNVIEMINKRFNELGIFRKLSTQNKTVAVGALNELNRFVLKTGTILWYAGVEIPDGWKLCDGSIVNISDYPELYSIIGDTYNLPTDTFDTDASFRLPSGTARIIVGHDANNPKFDKVGYRDGMNETPVDIDFTKSQHKITDIKIIQNDTKAGVPIPLELDKNYDLEVVNTPAWYPDSFQTDGNGYDEWRQYRNETDVKVITSDVDWYRFSQATASTSVAGSEGSIATHYNIQPYLTLKMIIKLDKESN